MENAKNLPSSWIELKLGDICSQPQYGFTTSGSVTGNLKLLRTTDITSGNINWNNVPYCKDNPSDIDKYLLYDGDIVISRAGSIGFSYLIKNPKKSIFASYLIRFRPIDEFVIEDYFYLFLKSPFYWNQIKIKSLGIAISNINASKLRELKIPLAPIPEQQRIVNKIEELFSELDKGVENLIIAQQKLKVYRQSVLKSAFEGKLTINWRENKKILPSKDKLLKEIIKEQNENLKREIDIWEKECIEANDKGLRFPRKPKMESKNISPNNEDLSSFSMIPDTWIYVYLSSLGDLERGKSKHRPRNDPKLFKDGMYPFIQTGEVKAANKYIKKYSATYNDIGLRQSKLWPIGTLCITIAANIAESAFLAINACFPDSIVGFNAFNNIVLPEYIYYFMESAKLKISAYAPATAQKNINLETLENLIIPYCSLAEQQAIVSDIQSRLSIYDKVDEIIKQELEKTETLRQSILKKAFEGKLVPQDTSNESAGKLLERIRSKREMQKIENKTTNGRAKK